MNAQNNTYYIAVSMKIQKSDVKTFKKEVKNQCKLALQKFEKDGRVKDYAVYSHKKTAEQHGSFQEWNYLLLVQVKNKECAGEIIPNLKTIDFPFQIETIRMELMVTTPESTYPSPGRGVQKRRLKPFYAVEYVDVKEAYLKEFRDIMIKNNGPAMRHIIENKKWCYNFYALETVTVFYHNTKYPTWNQIHVIGLYVESVVRYKKDFSEGLQLASQITFEDNFARLKQIRTMLYKSIGSKQI